MARAAHPGAQLGAASPQVSVHPVWGVLSAVCGLLVVLAGVLVAWRGQRWRAMSARYDRPQVADAAPSAEDEERARQRANAALWTALDRGDDPTRGEH